MKEIITNVTNFINENTMLLIGICGFLILALIVYLIDNSIKTKKMQKALTEMDQTEDKVVESTPSTNETVPVETKEEVKNEEPKFDSISLVDEEKEETTIETPVAEETTSFVETPAVEEPIVSESIVKTPTIEEPVISEPVVETPTIESKVETPVVEEQANSKFTNKKSLSEILAKKKESININDTEKTLEETTDFNNTF